MHKAQLRSMTAFGRRAAAAAALAIAVAANGAEVELSTRGEGIPPVVVTQSATDARVRQPLSDSGDAEPLVSATLSDWSPAMAPLPPPALAAATVAPRQAVSPAPTPGPVVPEERGGMITVILMGALLIVAAAGAAVVAGQRRSRGRTR